MEGKRTCKVVRRKLALLAGLSFIAVYIAISESVIKENTQVLFIDDGDGYSISRGFDEPLPHQVSTGLLGQQNADLALTKVPNTVFYVWCGQKVVDFTNYLSVLSSIRHLVADNIIFYFDSWPQKDMRFLYNTWLDEIKNNFPFFTPIEVTAANKSCNGDQPNLEFIFRQLEAHGGVYMSANIVFVDKPDLNVDLGHWWNSTSKSGVIMAARNQELGHSVNDSQSCFPITLEHEYTDLSDTPCIEVQSDVYPKDFWARDDRLGEAIRLVFYGWTDIRLPVKDTSTLVPNIAHMVWVGGAPMDFMFYLGVLSLLYVAEVDAVYVHGDLPPSGPYWDKLQTEPRLRWRYRNFLRLSVFGKSVSGPRAYSDVMRADIMAKYGGIYIDTDAIVVKPFDEDIRSYEAVASYSIARRDPYPDSVVPGLILAKPGNLYFRLLLRSWKDLRSQNPVYNPLQVPYKILERYPWLLHIEPRIQVVCLKLNCKPTWVPGYKTEDVNISDIKDWRKDTNVFHFTANGTPPPLADEGTLRSFQGESMFADMGRYILQKAGRWNERDVVKKEK